MKNLYRISPDDWHSLIRALSVSTYNIFVPVRKNGCLDYSLLDGEKKEEIIYNEAKPATPLKMFFLPVKLNVTEPASKNKKTVVIGAPSCDVEGLKLLDLIYLDEQYVDETYLHRRENTLIISTDCYSTQENCHCTTYGINPYASDTCDISFSSGKDFHYLMPLSEKGDSFINELSSSAQIKLVESNTSDEVTILRKQTIKKLSDKNERLPSTEITGKRISTSDKEIWKKYSSKCVSCGACSAICPTCSCFLLIDRPFFEKVKQQDTCQYPAFERVAGGEDPLKELSVRFKNRYMCKYVWKPRRFNALACTGCGRCIEACISKISKNELILELS